MTYTLLGAPTFGFDLVRCSRGTDVAAVLLTAMSLTEADLPRLAHVHPGRVRRSRWSEMLAKVYAAPGVPGHSPSSLPAIIDVRALAAKAADGEVNTTVLLRQLERSRLGSAQALDRLVRREVFDWTWATARSTGADNSVATMSYVAALAADVVTDALVASYAAEALDPSLIEQLADPFQRSGYQRLDATGASLAQLPEPAAAVVTALKGLTPDDAGRLRNAVGRHRDQAGGWAPAMHEASWAVELSGRVRSTALAHLLGVQAFADAGFTASDGAYGVWNCVAGVIQAAMVSDLLGATQLDTLTRVWSWSIMDLAWAR